MQKAVGEFSFILVRAGLFYSALGRVLSLRTAGELLCLTDRRLRSFLFIAHLQPCLVGVRSVRQRVR